MEEREYKIANVSCIGKKQYKHIKISEYPKLNNDKSKLA
jgi:hypothetical protein